MHKNLCIHAHFFVHHDSNAQGDRTGLLASFAPPLLILYTAQEPTMSHGDPLAVILFWGELSRCITFFNASEKR